MRTIMRYLHPLLFRAVPKAYAAPTLHPRSFSMCVPNNDGGRNQDPSPPEREGEGERGTIGMNSCPKYLWILKGENRRSNKYLRNKRQRAPQSRQAHSALHQPLQVEYRILKSHRYIPRPVMKLSRYSRPPALIYTASRAGNELPSASYHC